MTVAISMFPRNEMSCENMLKWNWIHATSTFITFAKMWKWIVARFYLRHFQMLTHFDFIAFGKISQNEWKKITFCLFPSSKFITNIWCAVCVWQFSRLKRKKEQSQKTRIKKSIHHVSFLVAFCFHSSFRSLEYFCTPIELPSDNHKRNFGLIFVSFRFVYYYSYGYYARFAISLPSFFCQRNFV